VSARVNIRYELIRDVEEALASLRASGDTKIIPDPVNDPYWEMSLARGKDLMAAIAPLGQALRSQLDKLEIEKGTAEGKITA
jgi:hypothetical protein